MPPPQNCAVPCGTRRVMRWSPLPDGTLRRVRGKASPRRHSLVSAPLPTRRRWKISALPVTRDTAGRSNHPRRE